MAVEECVHVWMWEKHLDTVVNEKKVKVQNNVHCMISFEVTTDMTHTRTVVCRSDD